MKSNGTENPGTTERSPNSSVEDFDLHAASVPEEIGGEALAGEVLPPEAGAGEAGASAEVDEGWPVEAVGMIFSLPFFLASRRYGELWELDEKETEKIGAAWKPILDRWLPTKETALGTALLVTLAIAGPRVVLTDWQKVNAKKSTAPGANTKTAASSGSPASSASEGPANHADWEPFSVK